ncbi:tryptophan aminotransferase-related protein 3-like [Triticum dicoccoides]|uniref:tryptophan aminotransferase-related protein 3-like n=1 Tax=Triticum dicoccoides TaxID=85692 RepID=UPI0018903979|nr:tryptophan aminotransferase-related protein 3-like [Triticum dicoccoides]
MESAFPTAARLGLHVLLYSSLLLNALFLAHHFLSAPPAPSPLLSEADNGGGGGALSWALRAARDAESVAAAGCSGHGRVFLDGIVGQDGRPGCECNTCFEGPDCSVRTPDCTVDADSGDPMFLEPYWMQHAEASAVVVSGWHRMSYRTTDGLFQSVELERCIRRLHAAVGNAVADDKQIVFATGSMQLINALVYALSPDSNSGSTASVVATTPYYPAYRTQIVLFDSREYRWAGNTSMWAKASGNSTTKEDVIEFVTSPNNPDAVLHQPVVGGSSAILDHAYFWPHFTHIPAPSDEDVMLFTTSKLSGHASSRFGWALIRDEKVAKRVNNYILQNTMGTSRDTQLRMLSVFKAILANLHGKEDIFAFGHDVMTAKWRKLSAVVSRSRRISLQNIPPQYCTYFDKIREPSPAYAWVKCEREEDSDCSDVLLKAKIITRSGVWNDASSRYTRISLIKSQDDFDLLLERITEFVDAELTAAGSNSM